MGKRRSQGEGTLYFDEARGRWIGQVWIDGRRRKVSARTKVDATAALGRLVHGDPTEARQDRRITVGRLIEEWKRSLDARAKRGEVAPSTVEAHLWACRLWTEQVGSTRAADLTVDQIEAALGRMRTGTDQHLSKASMVKVRSTLTQVYKWSVRRQLIANNPVVAVEIPTEATEGHDKRALTDDEAHLLLEALEGHPLRALFLVSLRLGLRPGEAAGLCTDALDLEADPPTLSVTRAVQLKRGRPVLVDDLKTKGSRRTLAVPAEVAEALRHHVESTQPEGLLWSAPRGGPLWPSTVRGELADACETAGIARVTPNELRHTAATRLADAGLPPHVLADVLGHTSTRMLDAVYRHRPAVIRGADLVNLA